MRPPPQTAYKTRRNATRQTPIRRDAMRLTKDRQAGPPPSSPHPDEERAQARLEEACRNETGASGTGSNLRPAVYKTAALPTELRRHLTDSPKEPGANARQSREETPKEGSTKRYSSHRNAGRTFLAAQDSAAGCRNRREARSTRPKDEAHRLIEREFAEIQKQTEREAGAADEDQRGARAQMQIVGIVRKLRRGTLARPAAFAIMGRLGQPMRTNDGHQRTGRSR